MLNHFTKQPSANKDYDFNWSDWLRVGDDLASAVVTVTPASGLTLGTMTIDGIDNIVKQFVSGGVDGSDYKLTCRITTTQGRVDECEIYILVRDL
jgi:hypothetical protein